jgi:hypothetical protein
MIKHIEKGGAIWKISSSSSKAEQKRQVYYSTPGPEKVLALSTQKHHVCQGRIGYGPAGY